MFISKLCVGSIYWKAYLDQTLRLKMQKPNNESIPWLITTSSHPRSIFICFGIGMMRHRKVVAYRRKEKKAKLYTKKKKRKKRTYTF